MYWMAAVIVMSFLGLTFLAGREEVPEDTGSLLRPFYKCAGYLYRRLGIRFPQAFRAKSVTEDLGKLYPGDSVEILQRDYYVKKLALCLMVTVVGSLLGVAVKLSAQSGLTLESGKITRGDYPEEKEIQITAEYDEETYEFALQINPRQLSEEETRVMFDEMLEALPEEILGENESLQQVYRDLNLTDLYEEYPATVEWKSSSPDVLSRTGRVHPPEEAVLVTLTVTLSYGDFTREGVIEVVVTPPILSEKEAHYQGLLGILEESDRASAEQREWQLPALWEGEEVSWKEIVEDNSALVGMGTFGTAVLVYVFADRDLHEKLEQRKKKLRREYPEIVHKLELFIGAGMTIRGAFQKIASDSKGPSPAYAEMLYTCHELGSGVSESVAYEHFGKRTGLAEYIRLSTLLMQNLKRGNSALLLRLREEADRAAEERLQQSKKLGEEASTKLLLPMVMMLAVVMVMIMAPAFSAM